MALGLAFAGVIGFVPGIVGLWLAYREASRIRAGNAPRAGEAYVTLARALGWVHVAAVVTLVALGLHRWLE